MRWGNLPLSLRLTAVYVGLVAALLVADGTILFLETRGFLIDSTAIRMRAIAKPVIDDWLADHLTGVDHAADLHANADRLSIDLTSRDTVAVVADASGAIMADGRRRSPEPYPVPLDPENAARALGGDNEVTYVVDHNGRANLVALIPLRDAPADPENTIIGLIQLSTPLVVVEEILDRERLWITMAIAMTLALVGIGGYLLTKRALGPLGRVVETSRQIAAGDLSQRVSLPTRRDEVGQVSASFDAMVDRIETAFATQRRFLAAAAHELRTPITALRGSSEVLLRGSRDDPAATRQLLLGMHRDLARLGRLAEQLLNLARMDAALPLARESVDVADFMDEQVRSARLLAREHNVVVDGGRTRRVSVDPQLLGQAILDLVDNAALHSPPGRTISITWTTDPQAVRIAVADEGEGIADRDLPHIFEAFYRGDRSRSRRSGGTGLGLALVRSMVTAHGGTVSARSRPEGGATFMIVLPLGRSA